ncbi:hypothetical protein LB507_011670 [Fusarium sp. FIESC RH6]|nr:hypothetical protein LB507_011670 [Fusarium sp. FIESC RH6]
MSRKTRTASRFRGPSSKSSEARKSQQMESVTKTASKTNEVARPTLLSLQQMPEWFGLESNQWILHGYRPISGSVLASIRSLWYVHNESANIYSHFVPAVFFLVGNSHIQQYLAIEYSGLTSVDSVVFSIFMFTAVTCLSLSATYHTLTNHSQRLQHFCLQLDMLGIVTFISGDHVLGIYTIFRCETLLRNAYWSMSGFSAMLTALATLHPKFQGPRYRLFQASAFVAAGLSGVAPLIHGINMFGMPQMMRKAFPYTLAKAVCLLSGALFYAPLPKTRFPERRYPGCFDLWGSHFIFHVLVVCAAVVQLIGYLDAFDYAHAHLTCPSH